MNSIKKRFKLHETDAMISAYHQEHIVAAIESIKNERRLLEDFIINDPFFLLTLEPYDLKALDAPKIVAKMIEAGALFGIGPMSAVAGAIAEFAVSAMVKIGAEYAIVENGGDISILNDKPVTVGIYAGHSPISNIAFEIPPRDSPIGICTSSGTVGPSISFGFADAAVVLAENAIIADSAATALGNNVTKDGALEDCFSSINRHGVKGALVIRGKEMALWGDIPPIVHGRLRSQMITHA